MEDACYACGAAGGGVEYLKLMCGVRGSEWDLQKRETRSVMQGLPAWTWHSSERNLYDLRIVSI